ncbi:MAG: hypothetical protein HQK89_14375, partial [Nitrospirae bacterium]|nr:hypothetical protein [Nitrospirota bacterium]
FGRREREDKSVLTEARCPYCREFFPRPAEVSTLLGFFSGGTCSCGSVFVYDASGKNMGEAFMDALAYACGDDWDMASSLEASRDYQDYYINYREYNHTVSPDSYTNNPFEKCGNLVFVKLIKAKTGNGQ